MPEQDLKEVFACGLLPIYKLYIIHNHNISLGDMIDFVIKKETCINKICTIKNKDHASPL